MDELMAQFLAEGADLVQQASDALMTLERAPQDRAAIDDAFRAFHTLKGSAGLFDLPDMTRLLHHAEDLLGAVRSGARAVDADTVGRLLGALGQVERWLMALEANSGLPDDSAAIAEQLVQTLDTGPAGDVDQAPIEAAPMWAEALVARRPASLAPGLVQAIRYVPAAAAYFGGDDPMAILGAVPGLAHLELTLTGEDAGPYDPFTCRLAAEAISTADAAAVRAAFRFVPDQVALVPVRIEAATSAARLGEGGARSLRVDVARIDALSAVTAELVAARTALSSAVAAADSAEIRALAAHAATIDRLTNRIHERVTALRMAPIAPVLRRFPRLVRELAEGLGKSVDVQVEDGGVEADKAIIEGLSEPLTHLLRNAVDHGIEPREVRMKAGKPPVGRIALTASEAGGRLSIVLEDDGAGIDPAAIAQAVAGRGLVSETALQAMDEAELLDLIFLPGASTAGQVTDLSGRGVGMDAVRSAIRALGGRIGLSSAVGRGTRFELSLPLAVSLTKVMVVSDGTDHYGLVMDSVLETLRLPAARVAAIRDGHAFDWRRRAVPLTPLSALTGGGARLNPGDQRVVVVRAGGQPVGLAIAAIEDRLDVAMRPLDGLLAGMPGVSGTALLGDGQVLMILDTEGLAP